MYNASELFIINDVLEIYTQQKQNNECMFITTYLESRAADDHKVKKFTCLYVLCGHLLGKG